MATTKKTTPPEVKAETAMGSQPPKKGGKVDYFAHPGEPEQGVSAKIVKVHSEDMLDLRIEGEDEPLTGVMRFGLVAYGEPYWQPAA